MDVDNEQTKSEFTSLLSVHAKTLIPSVEQLLVMGGDDRIALDAQGVANKYGCQAFPDANLIALGSSTASVISESAFAAAEQLRQSLVKFATLELQTVTYSRELQRIRCELLQLCGVTDLAGIEIVFAASGSDLHLIASQLMLNTNAMSGLAVMVDAVETGSYVSAALAGHHFSSHSALGDAVEEGTAVDGATVMEVVSVKLRNEDGLPRDITAIDHEVSLLVTAAALQGRRVLLTMVDVSKTGMIAPSPGCAIELKRRWPEFVEVLVDACQFRIAPPTLHAYLQMGFMVALTGSKFLTGPTFAGALLFPPSLTQRLCDKLLPHSFNAYSTRGDWPQHWQAARSLANVTNFGLLIRWQAALTELRAFSAVPESAVIDFIHTFAQTILNRLQQHPLFEVLPVPKINRQPLAVMNNWDQLQTIFPFVLYHPVVRNIAKPLSREQTMQVYRMLQGDLGTQTDIILDDVGDENFAVRYQLGQPVACGYRAGVPVSALRICISARLIVEANTGGTIKTTQILAQVMSALDKTAALVLSLSE